jgi:cytochrome c peroxidase
MACATCHDPAKAHAQDNDLSVQLGGPELATPGFRAVPSLRYMNLNIPFFFANDGTPTGGFTRDGGARDLVEQAHTPILATHRWTTRMRRHSPRAWASPPTRAISAACSAPTCSRTRT